MRTIATSANGTFDSGILHHGARGEGWRAWDGILRVKNNEAGSCTVTLINEVTGEPAFPPLSVGANAGVSGPVFTIPGSYRVTVTSVTGATRCRIVLDGDTAKDSQTDLLALYDFLDGDVSNLFFGSNVRGAVSRDSLVFVDAGEQRRTDEFGLLCEPQTINKCINTNLKSSDTTGTISTAPWTTHESIARGDIASISQDAADTLDQLDPQGNVTYVFHSISNAAGSIQCNGIVGNLNPHTVSQWQYVISGAATCTISGQFPPTSGPNGWERTHNSLTPTNTDDQFFLTADQPTEVLWFGNQLEEGTAAANGRTSLIEISGAAATRLGDNVFANAPASLDPASFTVATVYETYLPPYSVSRARVTQVDSGNNTAGQILYSFIREDNQRNELRDDVAAPANGGVVNVVGVQQRQAFGFDGQGNYALSVDGGGYTSSVATPPNSYAFVRFASQFDSSNQIYGYIKRVAIYDRAATEDYLTTGTTAGSGFDDGFDDGFG